MIRGAAFQTKARTVDHLGREQIADCPTAISELWKNAFDAYARNVVLDIFDGEEPVAVLSDDGHGMSRDDFEGRWLVVGTESKATTNRTPVADRNGLEERPRQGQKGIGRLSCANLGPTLLLVSKRRNSAFVAAMLDWRLFENPFINLSDVFIPIAEFGTKAELLRQLPDLTASLLQNVHGGEEPDRAERLRAAWRAYDLLFDEEQRTGVTNKLRRPSEELTSAVGRVAFEERHLGQWPVWTGDSEHGTALLVNQINYDLRVELDGSAVDSSARAARERFFETLSSFVDPFFDPSEPQSVAVQPDFAYAVRAWSGSQPRLIVGSTKQFDRRMLDGMEHQLFGTVSESGTFVGRVKAFGQWVSEPCVIEPPKDLIIPRRADTIVGPFDLYIASMEFLLANTTLARTEYERFQDLAERYSGFMMFRDGLRVLPYGRTDNDFFDIEHRRSKNAGREFWNHRQMFGRLAIRRDQNPNLKDKAGREGLLDNRAAKALKELVSHILMTSARRYFGSASDIRAEVLPQVQAANAAQRADEARKKLRKRQREEFRGKLQSFSRELPQLNAQLESAAEGLSLRSEEDIAGAQQMVEEFRERVSSLRLPGAPKSLGTLEAKYADYRDGLRTAINTLNAIATDLDEQIERIQPARPRELLERQISRNAAQIHRRILQWRRSIEEIQKAEAERIREIVNDRNKLFHAEATPLLANFDRAELSFAEASKLLDRMKESMDAENDDLFAPYLRALESMRESIDLEHLASFGIDEVSDLRGELDRLNSLAQLGIAVEIVGHELQSYDDIIGSGLRRLPDEVRQSKAAKDIETGYDGLTDQLRFLSPLRLAGQRIQRWITGREIFEYVSEFFKPALEKNNVVLDATERFEALRVFDQQSRLYPVFINLVNNSVYWVSSVTGEERRILLDVVGGEAVISDNGPGVDMEDVGSLFSLFFTKKARGGRGVGLYLARANLAAGGHKIRYEPDGAKMPMTGANFLISFRGAEFGGG